VKQLTNTGREASTTTAFCTVLRVTSAVFCRRSEDAIWRLHLKGEGIWVSTVTVGEGRKTCEMPKRVWFSGNASVSFGLETGVLSLEVLSDGEYTQC
jgi:hypothetical protein